MIFAALIALSPLASAQDTPEAFDAPYVAEVVRRTLPASMPALSLRAHRGEVIVRSDPDASRSEVVTTPIAWDAEDACEVIFSGNAEQAIAEIGRGRSGLLAPSCEVSVEIVLAGATALDIEVDRGRVVLVGDLPQVSVALKRGRVALEDTRALADLRVGRGRITGSASGEGLTARVRVGRVTLENLRAPVDVQVGLGGAILDYAAVFDGSVIAHTKVGRVRLRFPYGAWLNADLDAGLGWVRSDIPSNTDALTHLEASSGFGSVDIDTL